MFDARNMTENTLSAFRTYIKAGWTAMGRGVVYYQCRTATGEKSGKVKDELIRILMEAGMTSATASNRVSRIMTASDPAHFKLASPSKDSVDKEGNEYTFCTWSEVVAEYLKETWGDINEIRKGGPGTGKGASRAKAADASAEPKAADTASIAPKALGSYIIAALSDAESVSSMTLDEMTSIRDLIEVAIAARVEANKGQVAKAA